MSTDPGVMCTDHDEVTYGCEESIPGNCPCDDDDCENSPHSYEHICTGEERHEGRHRCCCGRNWPDEEKPRGCIGCLVDTQPHTCGFKATQSVIPRRWAKSARLT